MAGPKSRGIGTGAAVRRIARPAPSTPTAPSGTAVAEPDTIPSAASPAPITVGAVPAQVGGSIVAALQRQGGHAATEVLLLAPGDIAEHPDNPRDTLGDLSGLIASVREMGILQPILVLPRREYLTAYPHHAEHVGEKSWVTVAGHRRLAAAREAELTEVPALTRADLANPHSAIRTFLAENVHRQELAPLEEARAFAMLIELGLSQYAVATENGVSQSHVSKRLRLLQLSSDLQDAVRRGDLSIGDALVLSSAPAEDRSAAFVLAQQRSWPMSTAVGRIAQDREAARQAADAVDLDAPSHDDSQGQAPTTGAARTGRVRPSKSVAAAPTDAQDKPQDEVTAETAVPTRWGSGQGSEPAGPVPVEATEKRVDACRRLVRNPPAAAQMLEDLAVAVLHGRTPTAQSVALTHDWIGDQIGAHQEDVEGWRGSVVKRDQPRLAWALAIAALHLSAADSNQTWTTAETHLAHQLTRTGWYPTPAEAAHLQQVETQLHIPAPASSSDSTESPHQAPTPPQPAMDPQEGTDA